MAAYTTTLQTVGINGIYKYTQGALLSLSSATSQVTLICGALEDVVIFGYNPSGADDITITINASTAEGYAQTGRGNLVLTTALASSDYFVIAGLESNWFQSTANSFVITATTAILMAAIEVSSTRQN
jgi:hypothetical protein